LRVEGLRLRVESFTIPDASKCTALISETAMHLFQVSGFGLGLRASSFGFRLRVSCLGFGVSGFGFGLRVLGFGFRVLGFGFRISGFDFGLWVSGFGYQRFQFRKLFAPTSCTGSPLGEVPKKHSPQILGCYMTKHLPNSARI
jgi:hypothetical protein